jgi:hypothetical protein
MSHEARGGEQRKRAKVWTKRGRGIAGVLMCVRRIGLDDWGVKVKEDGLRRALGENEPLFIVFAGQRTLYAGFEHATHVSSEDHVRGVSVLFVL